MKAETITGTIFDIRRFSTHDGAGIRTTVFLKGCPLRCVWCQNPEGISPEPQLVHFPSQCILCGSCLAAADGAVQLTGAQLILDAKKVKNGAIYEDICPAAALVVVGRVHTVEEVLRIVLRDAAFFRYGGGVTLSGGEPFMQKAFTLALLKALKAAKVHTAVESSLHVDSDELQCALPYIDTLFVDFKVADDHAYKKAVGTDPALIQRNLAIVLGSAYRERVIVRTPLVPGYTATKENIAAICRVIRQLDAKVQYELLNYNPLAEAKYRQLGLRYCFDENPRSFNPVELEGFYAIARQAGIENLITEG